MSTLPTTTKSADGLSRGELTYTLARNQAQAHTLMVRCVKESRLSQKELAALTGIDEATLSRTLTRPRNVELNTISKIVFAACGASLKFSLAYPSENAVGSIFLARIDVGGRSLSTGKLFRYRSLPHDKSPVQQQRVVTKNTASKPSHVTLETGENRILEVSSA